MVSSRCNHALKFAILIRIPHHIPVVIVCVCVWAIKSVNMQHRIWCVLVASFVFHLVGLLVYSYTRLLPINFIPTLLHARIHFLSLDFCVENMEKWFSDHEHWKPCKILNFGLSCDSFAVCVCVTLHSPHILLSVLQSNMPPNNNKKMDALKPNLVLFYLFRIQNPDMHVCACVECLLWIYLNAGTRALISYCNTHTHTEYALILQGTSVCIFDVECTQCTLLSRLVRSFCTL